MKKTLLSLIMLIGIFTLSACNKQGPAEKLGEDIDNTVNKVEDKINDRGPLEKAADRIEDSME